jgi:hypothetical protein
LGVSFKNITLRGFLALHLTGKLFLAWGKKKLDNPGFCSWKSSI